MMKIGFIGLGHLGKTIAKRLLQQGVDLIVWNRSPEKARDLGVPIAQTPADLINQVDKVFVIVFDSAASEEVIFGKDGLVKGNVAGKTVVDMTTNHYAYAELAFKELKRKGAYYLDAPVLGSVIPAQRGELTVVVGGERRIFEECKPIFEKFCKHIFYMGAPGKASKAKLINNIVLGGIMDLLAEAAALAERVGIGKELMMEILNTGAGRSYILDVKRKKLLEEDFSPHFTVDLIYKDLHYAQDLIKDVGSFSFTTAALKETYALARSRGLGDLDFSAVMKLFTSGGTNPSR